MPQRQENFRPPVAREGWGYTTGLALLGALSLAMGGYPWAVLFLSLASFVAYFFRDPERTPPSGPGVIASPADGRVVAVEDGENGGRKIGIFLAIYNVHINRSPVAGVIRKIEYRPGKFMAAFNEKADEVNEQNAFDIVTESGEKFRVVQIAGLIARRIVCWTKVGDVLNRGQRIGLIQFGSRTDLYFPPGYEITVKKGDKVRGGETTVARATQG